MAVKIAFFDAKPYDEDSFNTVNENYNFNIEYFKGRLDSQTLPLAKGADIACIFVNGICDKTVIDRLTDEGVKLIALRCAGFNNVDVQAAKERGHTSCTCAGLFSSWSGRICRYPDALPEQEGL